MSSEDCIPDNEDFIKGHWDFFIALGRMGGNIALKKSRVNEIKFELSAMIRLIDKFRGKVCMTPIRHMKHFRKFWTYLDYFIEFHI